MKIKLFKKIKHFVLKALKTIGIAFILILIADIFSLIWKGGHTYEVYKTGPLFLSDMHDEGFYTVFPIMIISIIICYLIELGVKNKNKDK